MSEFTIEELSDAPCKVAGQKQVLAALENGQAEIVFVAENAGVADRMQARSRYGTKRPKKK